MKIQLITSLKQDLKQKRVYNKNYRVPNLSDIGHRTDWTVAYEL